MQAPTPLIKGKVKASTDAGDSRGGIYFKYLRN